MTSRFEKLRKKRIADRRNAGLAAAQRILEALQEKGVKGYLFGSMQTGDVHEESDVDILILDRATDLGLWLVAEEAAHGFPFDLVFWPDVDLDMHSSIMATLRASDLRLLQSTLHS